MRIGLDLDGVLYEWSKTARYMLRSMKGYPKDGPMGKESTSWNYIKENVSREDWRWLWSEAIHLGLYRYGHLTPGAIEAVRALSERGDVVLITQRPKAAVGDTLDWLSYMKLPITEYHILTEQEPKSSVTACDFYIDDKPANCYDLATNTKGAVFLWNRPWNHEVQWDHTFNTLPIIRVYSWAEVYDYIDHS